MTFDMEAWRKRIHELAAEAQARAETPEFKEQAARLAREEAEERAAERRSLRVTRGIPAALRPFLDEPKETEALATARAFLESDKRILLLAGDVGRGKSVAGAWLVDQVGGRFIEASDVVQTSIYDAAGQDRYMAPRLLTIDELGMEPLDVQGWGESKFYDLLNNRLQALKRTVLITNLDVRAFAARYPDQRIRDRLRAHAMWNVTKGASMRGE